jgi:hypothetical protein
MRPAGSIEASPRDMANCVEFFLGRGEFRGNRLLPSSAIDRMELPTSTYAAAEGLAIGYGLGNSATVWRNWVFHGHGGAVPGGLATLAYLPKEGVGYAIMINSENGNAINRLENAVRAYLLRGMKAPAPPPSESPDQAQVSEFSGWYQPVTPRNERTKYLEKILGVTRLSFRNGQLILRDLTNGEYAYVRTKGRLYRRLDNSRCLALIGDHTEGTLFQTAGGPTFRRMSDFVSTLKLGFALTTALLMCSSAVFALFWIPRRFFGDLKDAPYFGVRMDPLLATLSGAAVFALLWNASGDYFARARGAIWFGPWVPWASHLAHGVFAFFAIRGLVRALARYRSPVGRVLWWHCLVTSLVLAIWAVYLSYWGLRGDVS